MKHRPHFDSLLVVALILLVGMLVPLASFPGKMKPRPAAKGQTASASSLAGQSVTLLPNGKWLLVGGEGPRGPVAAAAIRDPQTGSTTSLSSGAPDWVI